MSRVPPDDLLDDVIESWPTWGLRAGSHIGLELAHAFHRGHTTTGMPSGFNLHDALADDTPEVRRAWLDALAHGPVLTSSTAPVPGCACTRCTGHSEPPKPKSTTSVEWRHTVDRARSTTIVDVLQRLGCNPQRRGRTWRATCPLHDDRHPSLSLDPQKGLWYCFPCGEGGDQIRLWMRARHVDFAAAVREIAR